MFVQDEKEIQIIRVIIEFANAKLKLVQDIQEIFSGMPIEGAKTHDWIGACTLGDLLPDQGKTRKWLLEIISDGKSKGVKRAARKAVAVEISTMMQRTIPAKVGFEADTKSMTFSYAPIGIEACISLGMALILNRRTKDEDCLGDRLGFCKLAGCGKINFTPKKKVWKFCDRAHREEYDLIDARKRAEKSRRKKLKSKKLKDKK